MNNTMVKGNIKCMVKDRSSRVPFQQKLGGKAKKAKPTIWSSGTWGSCIAGGARRANVGRRGPVLIEGRGVS